MNMDGRLMPEYVTIKLYADTRRLLRLIAAQTDEQMVQVMDRLCQEEVRKLGLNVATNVAGTTQSDNPQHRKA
jgi:hypothetical protein